MVVVRVVGRRWEGGGLEAGGRLGGWREAGRLGALKARENQIIIIIIPREARTKI